MMGMSNDSIELDASLQKIIIDEDGESKVTFLVPLTDYDKAVTLGKLTHQLLLLTVQLQNTNGQETQTLN